MFPHSLRWRLQLWLAFLLIGLLTGFGAVVWELRRVQQFNQLDEELQRRVVALSGALRGDAPGPPPFGGRGEAGEFVRGGKGPPPDGRREPPPDGWKEPPSFGGRRDGPDGERGGKGPPARPPGEDRGGPFGRRDIQLSAEVVALFDATATNAFFFALYSRSGEAMKQSAAPPAGMAQPTRAGNDTSIHKRTRDEWREAWHFTELGECVLVGRAVTGDLRELRAFGWNLFAAGSAVLILGLGVGWWVTTRAIQPIEEISAAAGRISAGNLAERITTSDPENELGRLAGVLNSTFARLEAAFAQQKQFTADAAHELRTPLAVLISEAQTALTRERTTAEYRDTVQECLAVAQQMRRLTESLLDLSRFDAGHAPVAKLPVDLVALASETLTLVQPLAEQRSVRLALDPDDAHCLGDAQRLRQVLTNLLTNAITYNRPGGEVRVHTSATASHVLLEIRDTGQGIAPEDLPHLFERFYRADKSRTGADGHAGLGLAICKAIVEAHGGTIGVTSQPGIGSTFSVRLPAV